LTAATFQPLDLEERKRLAGWLTKSGQASTTHQRKNLCNQIGVDHTKLDFLEGVAEDVFGNLLIEHLHRISDNPAIEALMEHLSKVLKGDDLKQLQELMQKFHPHILSSEPLPPLPNPAPRKVIFCYSEDKHETVRGHLSSILSRRGAQLQSVERDVFLAFPFPAIFVLSAVWLINNWMEIEKAFSEASQKRFTILLNPGLAPALDLALADETDSNPDAQLGSLIQELLPSLIFPTPNETLLACLEEQIEMDYHVPNQPSGTNIIALLYLSQHISETRSFSTQVLARLEQLSTINLSAPQNIINLNGFLAELRMHIEGVDRTFGDALASSPENRMGLTIQKAIEKVLTDTRNVQEQLLTANANKVQKAPQELLSAVFDLSGSLDHLSRRLGDLVKERSTVVFVLDG
jgi:hypothetical protein